MVMSDVEFSDEIKKRYGSSVIEQARSVAERLGDLYSIKEICLGTYQEGDEFYEDVSAFMGDQDGERPIGIFYSDEDTDEHHIFVTPSDTDDELDPLAHVLAHISIHDHGIRHGQLQYEIKKELTEAKLQS